MRILTNSTAKALSNPEPNLQDAVGLIALYAKFHDPLRFRSVPLIPTESLEKEVSSGLQSRKLIWPDSSSTLKVAAAWNDVETLKQDVQKYSRTHHWPTQWVSQSKELWAKLAAAECTEFFKYCLTERNILLEDEATVYENLKTLFPTYSVGQCYFFIFIGARDLSDAIQKGYSGRKSEAQIMMDACFKCEDYYYKKKKKVSNFRRHPKLLLSVFHQVLHTQIYCHGEEGFNTPPHALVSSRQQTSDGNDLCTSI